MSDSITLRLAALDDIDHIVTHRRRMFEDMGNHDSVSLSRMEQHFRPWVQGMMQNNRYISWLACNPAAEVIAGSDIWLIEWPPGQYDVSPYRGYILNVYTQPAYRRQGLARKLVRACMDWCYNNQVPVVMLHASDQGRPVYEALGFTPTNEMHTWKNRLP